MSKINLKYCIACILLGFSTLYSQAPRGDFFEYKVLPNRDTSRIDRQYGDWWFGMTTGPNLNTYFGKFILPEHPDINVPANPKHTFNTSVGSGLFWGLMAEYLPIGENWGYSVSLRILDYRYLSAKTDVLKDSLQTSYENTTSLNYLSLSPVVRYNFPISGLHAFCGPDFEINTSYTSLLRKKFINTGHIDQDKKVPLTGLDARFGLQLGVGWDIFIADVYGKARAKLTPYFSVQGATKLIADYGSTLNNVTFRFGFQLKITSDRIHYDTLPFDIDYEEPVRYIASGQYYKGIDFRGFRHEQELETMELKHVDISVIQEEAKQDTIVDAEIKTVATTTAAEKPKEINPVENILVKIKPNEIKAFSYSTSANTNLDNDTRKYLDEIAEFLKKSPGFQVRVIGHSDQGGSLTQNQQRARARAENVRKYLLKKGIAYGRILVGEQGALNPLSTNETESGRKKNRRVEITIVR